jgi:hypothetical protein
MFNAIVALLGLVVFFSLKWGLFRASADSPDQTPISAQTPCSDDGTSKGPLYRGKHRNTNDSGVRGLALG